jgi:hypothetical protein
LKAEVREALRKVLSDPAASAAAKASAARTLMEYFAEEESAAARRAPGEMTLSEIDAEIARLTPGAK